MPCLPAPLCGSCGSADYCYAVGGLRPIPCRRPWEVSDSSHRRGLLLRRRCYILCTLQTQLDREDS